MDKHDVLEYLAQAGESDATEAAAAFDVPFPTAAMALLRLLRQGLVARFVNPERGTYWYRLSPRGHARLKYFHS